MIGALGSPLGPHPESDLVTDLYSGSTPIANMDMFSCQISFSSLNKSIMSLSAAIGALGSPLGPHPESDLEIGMTILPTGVDIRRIFDPMGEGAGAIFHPRIRPAPAP
jgi:hypothetical protein